jgi:hypothetical protein
MSPKIGDREGDLWRNGFADNDWALIKLGFFLLYNLRIYINMFGRGGGRARIVARSEASGKGRHISTRRGEAAPYLPEASDEPLYSSLDRTE